MAPTFNMCPWRQIKIGRRHSPSLIQHVIWSGQKRPKFQNVKSGRQIFFGCQMQNFWRCGNGRSIKISRWLTTVFGSYFNTVECGVQIKLNTNYHISEEYVAGFHHCSEAQWNAGSKINFTDESCGECYYVIIWNFWVLQILLTNFQKNVEWNSGEWTEQEKRKKKERKRISVKIVA